MPVISSRRTQHDIACDMRLISGSIRTVNHQVIISRSGINRYHDIMMMDMSRPLFRNIVRLIKGEINSRLSSAGIMRMMVEIIVNLYLVRFQHDIIR